VLLPVATPTSSNRRAWVEGATSFTLRCRAGPAGRLCRAAGRTAWLRPRSFYLRCIRLMLGFRLRRQKTKARGRVVTVPTSIAAELRKHRRQQQEQRLAFGLGKATPDDLVFASACRRPLAARCSYRRLGASGSRTLAPEGYAGSLAPHPSVAAHCLRARCRYCEPADRPQPSDRHPQGLCALIRLYG
jgi:hypothetical protein